MELSEQNQKENISLTINKKQLHNKKEEKINIPNEQKQIKNQLDKPDCLIKQSENIIVNSKDNSNLSKDACQIIQAGDIINTQSTDFNNKIKSQNENVNDDLNTSDCIKSQKSEKDSKNNINQSKDTCQIIESGDITNEKSTDFNHKALSQNENVDQNTSNFLNSQKIEEEEKAYCQNIQQIFDSQGKKMVNDYSEENQKIIYEKLLQNKYTLEGFLKSGGEGDVFKGYRSEDEQQKVAFKIYSFEDQEDFTQEINLIKQFGQHQLIVKIFDSFEISISYNKQQIKCLILVMELCQSSLFDELNDFKHRQQFSFDQLFKIIFDLLDAVIKLRCHYTLHADIKSKNILKNQDNSYCFTDFGISQKKKNRDEKLIFKGGTRGYMAEEQYPDSELIDFKSDVFSLGKVFQTVIKVFQKINQNNSEQQMNIIHKFNEIIQEMLETDVQKRNSAMKIYKKFFKQINKVEFFDFNKSHYYHLEKIISQNANMEILQHQDYLYFQSLETFYDKIKFSIQKIISNSKFFILIKEYEIAYSYIFNFDAHLNLYLQKEYFDVENDWIVEISQKLISNIIKLKNQNEISFNKNKKGKQKLEQCYEKFKSFQFQPDDKYSQQRQQFLQNERLARICMYLSKYYFLDKNYDEANKFFEESLQFYKKIEYQYEQEDSEFDKAHLFLEYGDYQLSVNNLEEAENYTTNCYQLAQQLEDGGLLVVTSVFLLGFICVKKGDFEKAQQYFFQLISYEELFEDNRIYNQMYLYYLGYSIYLQFRKQKAPEIQNLNQDILEGLQVKYNELEEKKQKQQVDNNDSIEQNLEKAINVCYLNDDEKKIVKEKILKYISKQ